MAITKLNELITIAKQKGIKRLAIAAAADKHVMEAVRNAEKEGIVKPIFIGNKELIKQYAVELNYYINDDSIIDEPNDALASRMAVSLVKEGKADLLMKGLVATAVLLRAVLDKEVGLRKGDTLSHLAVFESPHYHKLIGVTDAAMNIAPEFHEKVAIINNAVEAMRGIGIETPKVAVIAPVEVVNPKIESTVHAAMLTQMNKRGQIPNCLVDGPLALDNAISKEACEQKKILTDVGGDADIMLAPELNAGNILYKALSFMGGTKGAAAIIGARCPIVLTSRADSEETKLLSIAFAAAMMK
ncbi:MAG: bifunctional enoyl-CoA hydratase/phosphate acetyltransferase [Bacteroidales bacterium]|nr:bifunctional enoyl-CoA hydratase/phosphate acetyltransferase [Bacteroidales bacterium]